MRFEVLSDPINVKPVLEIIKPIEDLLYIGDEEIITISRTLVLGPITIKTVAEDPDGEITKVELYIDNVLKNTTTKEPYDFLFNDRLIGLHNITIKAYDNDGKTTEKGLDILILNFGLRNLIKKT